MKRIHGLELHEQPWVPAAIRHGVTDQLQILISHLRLYEPIADRLTAALDDTRATRIIDLCAGGGGPWRHLLGRLPPGVEAVVLTDLFPNVAAFEREVERSAGRLSFHRDPVDATAVSPELAGFRTLFSSFHHFRPDMARAILQRAVADGAGIGVFEVSRRSLGSMLAVSPPSVMLALAATPFVRPFRWSRLWWTYGIPAIPWTLAFDGLVSCLRTYTPAELEALVAGLDDPGYRWDIGVARGSLPVPVTYLIGVPPG